MCAMELIKVVVFCCKAGIPQGVDRREAMERARMVTRILWARAEWKRRTGTVEVRLVR